MMAELSLLVKATIVLAMALATSRAARRAPASVRGLVLATAFAVLLVLPVAGMLVQPRAVVIPVASASQTLFVGNELPLPPPELSRPRPGAYAPGAAPAFAMPPVRVLLRGIWILGAVVVCVPLIAAVGHLRRVRRRGVRWPRAETAVAAVARAAHVRRRVEVVLSSDLAAPVTWGWVRPIVALPIDAPRWKDSDLQQALIHEIEHVRRRDWLVHLLARVACAVYWFHPLAWVAWRQFRLECERACDDAVVRGAEQTAYAEQLVTLARRLSDRSPIPLLSMANHSNLAERVRAVLARDVSRGRVSVLVAALIVGIAVSVTALISPIQAVGSVQDASSTTSDRMSIPVALDGPAFEAASVRPNAPEDRQRVSDWHLPSGRFTGRNQTLRWFIAFAYAPQSPLWLEPDDAIGGPEWIDTERFTIEAVAGRPVTTSELQRMVRQVLAARFGLRVHLETRPRQAYRLVLARPDRRLGPQVRETDENCGKMPARGPGGELGTRSEFSCFTMARLALDLGERVGRPVLDRTGFEAVFDASLTAARTPEELAAIYGLAPSAQPPDLLTGVSIFTALQEQLGVKLEPTEADFDTLVIDTADRPSPNDAAALPSAQPQASATPAFEVASIKRNRTSDPARARVEPGGRFTAANVPIIQIIQQAYGLRPFQVLNAPDWTTSEGYDILAKAPDGVQFGTQAMAPFLRALLRDRFAFSARTETRDLPIYALVTARPDRKPGPKLQASPVDCTGPVPARADNGHPDDKPPCALLGTFLGSNSRRYEMRGYPMTNFVQMLGGALDRHVADKTGLAGTWNIELTFSPDGTINPAPGDPPSIFTALQEQLELRLEPARGPVDMLAITRIERPTED